MIKPTQGRVVLKISKKTINEEGGFEPDQKAKVIASADERFKKGEIVIPVLAAWVPVHDTETKKDFEVIMDADDIMGYYVK